MWLTVYLSGRVSARLRLGAVNIAVPFITFVMALTAGTESHLYGILFLNKTNRHCQCYRREQGRCNQSIDDFLPVVDFRYRGYLDCSVYDRTCNAYRSCCTWQKKQSDSLIRIREKRILGVKK